jgi:hypothetical protein
MSELQREPILRVEIQIRVPEMKRVQRFQAAYMLERLMMARPLVTPGRVPETKLYTRSLEVTSVRWVCTSA